MYKQYKRTVALVLMFAAAGPASRAGAQVTFSKDVAPVIFSHCAQCHHPGGSAPFSLLTYDESRRHATQIAQLTKARLMPPWKAEPGIGDFIGLHPLGADEIDL